MALPDLPIPEVTKPESPYEDDPIYEEYPHELEYYKAQRDKMLKFFELLDQNPDQREELNLMDDEFFHRCYRRALRLSDATQLELVPIDDLVVEPDSDGKWRGASAAAWFTQRIEHLVCFPYGNRENEAVNKEKIRLKLERGEPIRPKKNYKAGG